MRLRRWEVIWEGQATMYGFTLVTGDPVHARCFTRWGAERRRAQLEAEHAVAEGSAGRWATRRR